MPHTSKYKQRLDELFLEIERVAQKPESEYPAIKLEIQAIRARMRELDAQISSNEKDLAVQENSSPDNGGGPRPHAAPLVLFEKDRVGYAYSGDKVEPLQDPASLPLNGNEAIAVPLTASGQTIGEMRVATPSQRLLTQEEITLANAVAQQVSLQVQNLRLLAAAERARAEAETATLRFTHEGWDSYLDAIHQKERTGYAYDQAAVSAYEETLPANEGIKQPLTVTGEEVGALYLKPNPTQPLTEDDRALVGSVARQLAQQIESLRLLADAARARAEAEEATRRLTHESWQSFIEEEDEASLSFVYDSNQVIPMDPSLLTQKLVHTQPLTVRGETIGRLALAGDKEVLPEDASLVAAIAGQVSLHIETLRLTEELQKRALELEKLDKLKSSFLANMSHELRTPLNSILGFADVMLAEIDGTLTENMNNDLQLIQKNGQHLLHLINDVLDMAKIEAGRMNLSPERFRIHEIIEEVVSITSTLASEKSLSLFIENDSDQEVEIFADRTRMRQVMINLVNNAIKFTEQGRIMLHAMRQGERLLIRVRDTGIGIPADKQEAIFQEFTQVDTSSTRKVGGTGLGLPISRRLIEMHGGRLWVESTGVSGEGSTFFIELPLEAEITESIEKQEK